MFNDIPQVERTVMLRLFFIVLFILALSGLAQGETSDTFPFVLQAKLLAYSPSTLAIAAKGGCEAQYRGVTIKSSSLEIDLETNLLFARGRVFVEYSGKTIKGDELIYDLTNLEAMILRYGERISIVYVRGENLSEVLDVSENIKAALSPFSLADVEKTYTYLTCSKIELILNERIGVWDAVTWTKGEPSSTFPFFSLRLGEMLPKQGFVIDQLNISQDQGLSTGLAYHYLFSARNSASIRLGYDNPQIVNPATETGEHFSLGFSHRYVPVEGVNQNSTLNYDPKGQVALSFDYDKTFNDRDRARLVLSADTDSFSTWRTKQSYYQTHAFNEDIITRLSLHNDDLEGLGGKLEYEQRFTATSKGSVALIYDADEEKKKTLAKRIGLNWQYPSHSISASYLSRENRDGFLEGRTYSLVFNSAPRRLDRIRTDYTLTNTLGYTLEKDSNPSEVYRDEFQVNFKHDPVRLSRLLMLDVSGMLKQSWVTSGKDTITVGMTSRLSYPIGEVANLTLSYSTQLLRDYSLLKEESIDPNESLGSSIRIRPGERYQQNISLKYDLEKKEVCQVATEGRFKFGKNWRVNFNYLYNTSGDDSVDAAFTLGWEEFPLQVRVVWKASIPRIWVSFLK